MLTYQVSPALITGDTFAGDLTRAAGEDVNTYAISVGTLSAGDNYDMSFVSTDYSITTKPITVTADAAQTKVYGEADAAFTYQVAPALVSGDAFTGALSRAEGEAVNTYAIAAGTLSAGGNYDMSFVGADFTISKKPITVTADDAQSKIYRDSDPVFTYTVEPELVSGDSFSGNLAREIGDDAGQYLIETGSLTAGDNYETSFVADTFTILQKQMLIADPALTLSKVYDGTNNCRCYNWRLNQCWRGRYYHDFHCGLRQCKHRKRQKHYGKLWPFRD